LGWRHYRSGAVRSGDPECRRERVERGCGARLVSVTAALTEAMALFGLGVVVAPILGPAVGAYLLPLGIDPQSSVGASELAAQVTQQASMLAFQDAFWLTGIAALAMLPVVLILQRPKTIAAHATS